MAKLIGAGSREIIFTSGATESNNIAIKGVANFYRETGKNHLITVQTVRICVYLNVLNCAGTFFFVFSYSAYIK